MECTQRLECTQELYNTHTERVCPEQIGFLGICGAKHPVLRGPNKIGRDPQTCSIVLNLNSVSRQHAVINVLSSKEYMLMDLDSANKTKLLNKTLAPYIPHPLRNGDTVQFGDIFGIFRLLEEDDDLPMTQALDIPETPVPTRPVSKLTKVPTTMIPESPDVSDREESFATPQQSKTETTRLSSGQFIKPFGKSISIHPVSSPKSETSRNSSKKTISFVDNPNTSLNESLISLKVDKNAVDIHEMDTQAPYPIGQPSANESADSIYMADTQIPPGHGGSPSIHNMDTQIPTDHLPSVRKIDNQKEMQFDIYAANKDNDLSIFNADTQPFICEKDKSLEAKAKSNISSKSLNKSEEELLFDEIEDDCLIEDFNSQPLLPQESPKLKVDAESPKRKVDKESPSKTEVVIESDGSTDCEDIDIAPTQKVEELPKKQKAPEIKKTNPTTSKRNNRILSDDSTDCEDINIAPTQKVEELSSKPKSVVTKKAEPVASKRTNRSQSNDSTDCEDIEFMATQKIPELPTVNISAKENKHKKGAAKRNYRIVSDDSTDCEDLAVIPMQKIPEKNANNDEDLTDCEDDLAEVILSKKSKVDKVTKFDDMPTQVIDLDPEKIDKPAFEDMNTQIIDIDENATGTSNKDNSFEDQPTQLIDEIIPNNPEAAKKPVDEIVSPFKIPLQSPIKVKSKEIPKIVPVEKKLESITIEDDNYYNATQDIIDDLCSQREGSPILIRTPTKFRASNNSPIIIDDEVVPCSVEGYKVGDKFANIENDLSPTKRSKEDAKKYAAGLTSQEVRDVIGVDGSVEKLKKFPSDSSSDIESTPKKVRTLLFTDSDLPNSQEIKTSMLTHQSKLYATESSSESETEANTEEQFTPFLHRKKRPNSVTKIDLTKKFDVEKLPERVITRVRKPTAKMEQNMQNDKKSAKNILKPKFLTEQEDQIDQDIITENMKRLKTYEKAKTSKEAKNDSKSQVNKSDIIDDKNESKPNEENVPKDNKTENVKRISPRPRNAENVKTANTKEDKAEDIKAISPTGDKNESVTKSKTETKTKDTKEKIKVKIEKPKKKDAGKDTKIKDKEDTRKSKEESTVRKSNERTSAAKNKDDTNRKSATDKNKSKEDSLLSTTTESKISTRSTRPRRKVNENKATEKKSKSPDTNNKEPDENKRKRPTRRKEEPKESISPEVEIRRSKRQARVKEDKKSDSQLMEAPKSILKKSLHEQSTVYNISASSGDTTNNLKRSIGEDSDVPSPKRTRGFVNNVNSSSISNASLRATPARTLKTQHVLFTAFPSEEVKQKLEKLGAVIVTDVMQCTVVLTMQIKRTFKLLCAVGLGRPIVGPGWVQACVDTHMIVDPWLYLVKDDSAEKRFSFNLERTLNGKRNFLKGYNVSSTPSVQPNASEMRLIVECSGGSWKEGGSNWVCVSSTKDSSLWPALRKRGATIVSTEFILGGVLRQKIEITSNKFP